ncbi:MAG: hypothetical protein HY861_04515 [Chlamydiia bacterium]|nr:hypothetical protein [Chlamydiia bacterium]
MESAPCCVLWITKQCLTKSTLIRMIVKRTFCLVFWNRWTDGIVVIGFNERDLMSKRTLLILSVAAMAMGLSMPMHAQNTQNKKTHSNDQNAMAGQKMGLASARGCPGNNDLFVTADFLWWKAIEDDISLGFNQSVDSSAAIGALGDLVRFHPKWEPGFELGLGWNVPCDGWDLFANWTWFRDKASVNVSSPGADSAGIGIQPFWARFPTGAAGTYNLLHAHRTIQYNMFDVEMGRASFVSDTFMLRPFFGVTGGWINRTFSSNASTAVSAGAANQVYRSTSKYWGAGPRFGLDGQWRLGAGFRFFGDVVGSVLYGESYANQANVTTGVGLVSQYNDPSIGKTVPHLQLATGLGWGRCFCADTMFFSLDLGWEVNQFWNVPTVIYPDIAAGTTANTNGSSNREMRSHNLSLSGLTIAARFDF